MSLFLQPPSIGPASFLAKYSIEISLPLLGSPLRYFPFSFSVSLPMPPLFSLLFLFPFQCLCLCVAQWGHHRHSRVSKVAWYGSGGFRKAKRGCKQAARLPFPSRAVVFFPSPFFIFPQNFVLFSFFVISFHPSFHSSSSSSDALRLFCSNFWLLVEPFNPVEGNVCRPPGLQPNPSHPKAIGKGERADEGRRRKKMKSDSCFDADVSTSPLRWWTTSRSPFLCLSSGTNPRNAKIVCVPTPYTLAPPGTRTIAKYGWGKWSG